MIPLRKLARALARDRRGSIAILFGLSATVLFLLAGIAVDSSRAYNVSFKLQDGLDAAALAAAKLFDDSSATQADFQDRGENFFRSYLDGLHIDGVVASNVRVVPDHTAGSVTVVADVSIKTMFGALSEVALFDYTPSSTVIYKPKKIELALVLDITGSMCDSGAGGPCPSGAKLDALKAAATDVVRMLAGTSPGQDSIKISVVPYSASVNVGSDAAAVSGGASFDGCVVERTGATAYDDTGPGVWFPVSSIAINARYSCPSSDVLGLTDIADGSSRQLVLDKISGLMAYGATAGHIGLAWGWYSVSPSWSSFWRGQNAPRAFDPDRVIKAVVLMTDGMFNTSYYNGGESLDWSNPGSTDPSVPGSSGYQALQICSSMRGAGKEVKVYTVGFQTPPEAEELLKSCSGVDNYYQADNSSQLSTAFREIAKRLTSLRVSS